MKAFFSEIRSAVMSTLVLAVICSGLYPLIVFGISQALFRNKANGSLIVVNGDVVGSSLIGQNFTKPEYFQPRPSAAGNGYDATASAGSNYGPTNQKLIDRIQRDAKSLHEENPSHLVPVDLITTSASGLDPEITPAAAEFQIPRVARERGLPESAVRDLVQKHTYQRDLGLLGEARVNVLELNLALDDLAQSH